MADFLSKTAKKNRKRTLIAKIGNGLIGNGGLPNPMALSLS